MSGNIDIYSKIDRKFQFLFEKNTNFLKKFQRHRGLCETVDIRTVLWSFEVCLCKSGGAKNDQASGGFHNKGALANFGNQWLSYPLQNDTVPCVETETNDRTAPESVSFFCH